MRTILICIAAALAALTVAQGAAAHPLGNFTVNRHVGVEASAGDLYVRYVLDLAEIPTTQIGDRVRGPRFATESERGLEVRVDGRPRALALLERRVTSAPGAGGLETLRFEAIFAAGRTGRRIEIRDLNLPGRIGWREIVVTARDGATILESSAPAVSESDTLRAYPGDSLRSPLDVSAATAVVRPGEGAGSPPRIGRAPAPVERGGRFEALIDGGDVTLGLILVSLAIAMFWGAAHALTPGHGKALVAGYLIGTRGRPRDAFLLGATVTVTHTAGVFGLGLVTLALSQFIVPEQLYPWLTLVSGLLVVAVGIAVLRGRLGHDRHHGHEHHHHHEHDHHHEHHHHHHHRHTHDERLHRRGIVGVGIAAGLLPCPSALVVLLSAIALHRVAFGMILIVAFSIGLAATITAIGLVAVLARRAFGRIGLDGRLVRALPAVSAAVIVLVGVAITVRAIPGVT